MALLAMAYHACNFQYTVNRRMCRAVREVQEHGPARDWAARGGRGEGERTG